MLCSCNQQPKHLAKRLQGTGVSDGAEIEATIIGIQMFDGKPFCRKSVFDILEVLKEGNGNAIPQDIHFSWDITLPEGGIIALTNVRLSINGAINVERTERTTVLPIA